MHYEYHDWWLLLFTFVLANQIAVLDLEGQVLGRDLGLESEVVGLGLESQVLPILRAL